MKLDRRRALALAVTSLTVLLAVGFTATRGLVLDRKVLLIVAGCFVAVIGHILSGRSAALAALRAWLPFAAVGFAYDLTRGLADETGLPVHVRPQLEADRVLGLGRVPTERLQEWVDGPTATAVTWVSWVFHTSHFYVLPGVLLVLWFSRRHAFAQLMRAWVFLGLTASAVFVLAPTAPPWLAQETGALTAADRLIPTVWDSIPVEWAGSVFDIGLDYANPVAAIPSLHSAIPALLVLLARREGSQRLAVLAAAYAVGMGFSLVWGAEHYVVDVLIGWAFAALAFRMADGWAERRRAGGLKAPQQRTESDEPAHLPLVEAA